jgi:hypothetical protein
MKKVFLTLGFIGAVACANAQISQGTIGVGGSLSFRTMGGETVATNSGTSVTTEKNTETTFGINPTVLYFLTDNIGIGASLGYNMYKDAAPGDSDVTTSTMMLVGPMARYNMGITDKFGMLADLTVGLGFGGTKNEVKSGGTTTTVESDRFAMDISLRPGLQYFLRDNIAIQAHYGRLGYMTQKDTMESGTSKSEDSDNEFELNFDSSSLAFGFMWYFGK